MFFGRRDSGFRSPKGSLGDSATLTIRGLPRVAQQGFYTGFCEGFWVQRFEISFKVHIFQEWPKQARST